MPLQPDISLQVRPPQFQGTDPSQMLLTVAQLQNLQSQNALRQLQMGDLAYKMQTYRNLQDPQGAFAQLLAYRSGQNGGAQPLGAQGGTSAPATPAAPPPVASVQTPGPGAQPSFDPGQLSPYQADLGLAPGPASVPSVPRATPPPQPQPPAPAQPQVPPGPQQAQAPPQRDIMQDVQRQRQLYDRMYMQGHPEVVGPIIDRFMKMDQHLMEQQKGQLDFALAANNAMAQIADAVMSRPEAERPAAWQQARAVAVARGIPGAQQWPEQYNPQMVGALAAQAMDAKTRGEQQIAAWGRANDAMKNMTDRFAEIRKSGELVRTDTTAGPQFTYKYLPPGAPSPYAPGSVGGGLTPAAEEALVARERLRQTGYGTDIYGYRQKEPVYPGANVPPSGGGAGATTVPSTAQPLTGPGGEPIRDIAAVKFQSEQERALRAENERNFQPFQSVRTAYNQVQASSGAAAAKNRNAADLSLLYGFAHLSNPETARLNSPLTPEQIGTLGQRFKQAWDRVTAGGVLDPEQRRQLIDQSTALYKAHEQTYERQLAVAREQSAGYPNVRPEIAAPDIRANVPTQPPGEGRRGTGRLQGRPQQPLIPVPAAEYQKMLDDAKAQGINEAQLLERLRVRGYRKGP